MLLVEYSILDNVKVINESKNGVTKLKLLGKFQKCDEQNNNGRIYPRGILESQVKAIQGKIDERSLVGALDHPANDAIHLSQASHLITKLWVEKNGDVMGEAEILSTPNGKIVKALIGDGVKIGISSRGLGSVSESREGKVVNEDFKLITFDLVSDPSTKGAFPELTESMRENSQRAQTIISKHKKDRVLMTMLESKIGTVLESKFNDLDVRRQEAAKNRADRKRALAAPPTNPNAVQPGDDDKTVERKRAAVDKLRRAADPGNEPPEEAKKAKLAPTGPWPAHPDDKDPGKLKLLSGQESAGFKKAKKATSKRQRSSTELFRNDIVNRLKEAFLNETGDTKRRNKAAKRERDAAKGRLNPDITVGQTVAARQAAKHNKTFTAAASVRAGRETTKAEDAAKASVGPSKRNKLNRPNSPRKDDSTSLRDDIVNRLKDVYEGTMNPAKHTAAMAGARKLKPGEHRRSDGSIGGWGDDARAEHQAAQHQLPFGDPRPRDLFKASWKKAKEGAKARGVGWSKPKGKKTKKPK